MGRTTIMIEVSNYSDILDVEKGRLTPDKVRRIRIEGIVDTGAAKLVLPKSAVDFLGLPVTGQASVRYADLRQELRDIVKDAYVKILDRASNFTAIVEPNRTTALIGAIVMEELDFLVNCTNQTLVPREPERILAEVE